MDENSKNRLFFQLSNIIETDFFFTKNIEECNNQELEQKIETKVDNMKLKSDKIDKMNTEKVSKLTGLVFNTAPTQSKESNKRKRNQEKNNKSENKSNCQNDEISQKFQANVTHLSYSSKSQVGQHSNINSFNKSKVNDNKNNISDKSINIEQNLSKMNESNNVQVISENLQKNKLIDENSIINNKIKLNNSMKSNKIRNYIGNIQNNSQSQELSKNIERLNNSDISDLNKSGLQLSFGKDDVNNSQINSIKDTVVMSQEGNSFFGIGDLSIIEDKSILKSQDEIQSILNENNHKVNLSDTQLEIKKTIEDFVSKFQSNLDPVLRSVNFNIDAERISFVQYSQNQSLSTIIVYSIQTEYNKSASKLGHFEFNFEEFIYLCLNPENFDGFQDKYYNIENNINQSEISNLSQNKKDNEFKLINNNNDVCPKCKKNRDEIKKNGYNQNGITYKNDLILFQECGHEMCLDCIRGRSKFKCHICKSVVEFDILVNE